MEGEMGVGEEDEGGDEWWAFESLGESRKGTKREGRDDKGGHLGRLGFLREGDKSDQEERDVEDEREEEARVREWVWDLRDGPEKLWSRRVDEGKRDEGEGGLDNELGWGDNM